MRSDQTNRPRRGSQAYRVRVHALSLVLCATAVFLPGCPLLFATIPATENIAQEWNELAREALFAAYEGPTVEARTMFHVSAAMYDAWAAYDGRAKGYFTGDTLKQPLLNRTVANRAETLSHAVYGVLEVRFAYLAAMEPGTHGRAAFDAFGRKMRLHGYHDFRGQVVESEAQALGKQIAASILAHAAGDFANEANRYADTFVYIPINPLIRSAAPGTNGMIDPNRWQPIEAADGGLQSYLTPHWGSVKPFSLAPYTPAMLRFDPGPMPVFGSDTEEAFIEEFLEVLRYSHAMDPLQGAGADLINLSPRVRGLETPGEYYYAGHSVNPYTGEPYADNPAALGDYLRALAVYHDGKKFTTPVPWWNEVATNVMRGNGLVDRRAPNKLRRTDLGYDVKLYFALNAALHDVAIAIWEIKFVYDTSRPISGIRYLAEAGKLPIEPGFIEIILGGDPLAGTNGEYVGAYKVRAWAGPDKGVGWIRASEWHPYQAADFVTPPFPGYISGHTGFSRAAADVLTAYTGDPYFPGGIAQWQVSTLKFENDFTQPVLFQWATYRDMADETALARVVCGAHIPIDTVSAKPIGSTIAAGALELARSYFRGD